MKHKMTLPSQNDDRLLSKLEAIAVLGISKRTLERLTAGRKLQPVRILGAVRFRWSDIARAMQTGL